MWIKPGWGIDSEFEWEVVGQWELVLPANYGCKGGCFEDCVRKQVII